MKHNTTEIRARIVYFSHGAGPLPLLGDTGHRAMIDFVTGLPSRLRKPDAILVISAHWEESTATFLGDEHSEMCYDDCGFADEAYEVKYPAAGSHRLALAGQRLRSTSSRAGSRQNDIRCRLSSTRRAQLAGWRVGECQPSGLTGSPVISRWQISTPATASVVQ